MSKWTNKYIIGLKEKGTIRDYKIPDHKPVVATNGHKVVKKQHSKAIAWLKWNLWYWANEHALTLEEEYRFSVERQFRSDWALPAIKVLIEFEGGIFMDRGGHNSQAGIQRDIDKYSLAEKLGYRVIRLTAMKYDHVLTELNEIIA